jgi:UDP-N-acetylmuramoyl-tripeptide--D-alanyl-D-alanine ligase
VRFTTTEIARAVDGHLADRTSGETSRTSGEPVWVDGVSIDSRSIVAGELFVPVVGERDGHEFIHAAVERGAAAYLARIGWARTGDPRDAAGPARAPATGSAGGIPEIQVDSTERALIALGRHARTRLPDRVVGITGSVGKTTTKDLTVAALASSFATHGSPRSFNNELGVPLTLANSPDGVEAVVVEMGARGRGHIAMLCEIARPTIGVVTTVALAHAEMFGTIEEVAIAKGELVEALPPDGTAVLNGDHPLVDAMANRTVARVVTFGVERSGVDVTASNIALDDELRPSFHLHSPWGGADVRLEVRGVHQVMNALAAAAAALAAGASIDGVSAGLSVAISSPWRMELGRTRGGALVINDAYNANPTSMEAALRSLAAVPARRRIAIVGVMAELGPDGPEAHRHVAALAADLGIELIAVAAPDYGTGLVADLDQAVQAVQAVQAGHAGQAGSDRQVAVLVKGSRVAGLEEVARRLLA